MRGEGSRRRGLLRLAAVVGLVVAAAAIAAALRSSGHDVRLRRSSGDHDSDYWNADTPTYLRFYAGALAACRR
jgi:S-formylglutathione hydrolase FrmB